MKIMEKNFEELFRILKSNEVKNLTKTFNEEYRKYSLLQLKENVKDEKNDGNEYSDEYIKELKMNQKFIKTFHFTSLQVFSLSFYNFIYHNKNIEIKWLEKVNSVKGSWIKLFNSEEFILKTFQENIFEFKKTANKNLDDFIVADSVNVFIENDEVLKYLLESSGNSIVNNYTLKEIIDYVNILDEFSNQSENEFLGIAYVIDRILELNVKPEKLRYYLNKGVDNYFGDILEIYLETIKTIEYSNGDGEDFNKNLNNSMNKLFESSREGVTHRVNNAAISQEYSMDYIAMVKDFEEAFPNGLQILHQMIQEFGEIILKERFKEENSRIYSLDESLKPLDYKYFIENYNENTPMKWLVELTRQ